MSDPDSAPVDPAKRTTLALLAGTAVSGCCALTPIHQPPAGAAPLLAPRGYNTQNVPTLRGIDVHAHFFNASDVTVRGYVSGPVAHSVGGVGEKLLRALAPLADVIAGLAPTARCEARALQTLQAKSVSLRAGPGPAALLDDALAAERTQLSESFYRAVSTPAGAEFRRAYADARAAVAAQAAATGTAAMPDLGPDTIARALEFGEREPADRQAPAQFSADGMSVFGVLQFIGYMLSSRWANLRVHQKAFAEPGDTIGVRRALHALVDFEHWLDGRIRSPLDDQMKLAAVLATLSGDYMRPLIAFNPWNAAVDGGRSLQRLRDAQALGFVGVKIYPQNGFRPNGVPLRQGHPNLPPDAKLIKAMRDFWETCRTLDLPVMSHAGPSMGKDAAHDLLGGPAEWKTLLDETFWPAGAAPRINLGHFGGDDAKGVGADWPAAFARDVMAHSRGAHVYADLGFWANLRCRPADGNGACAQDRLAAVLSSSVGNGQTVADRVMFGSDWLMLSTQPHWRSYARDLAKTIEAIAPAAVPKIFGGNAEALYGKSLRLA